jgi:hypothetical protein
MLQLQQSIKKKKKKNHGTPSSQPVLYEMNASYTQRPEISWLPVYSSCVFVTGSVLFNVNNQSQQLQPNWLLHNLAHDQYMEKDL